MTIERRIEQVRQARALIAEAAADCGIPQFESMLREADTYLHWSLWNLGEDVELRPELEPRTGVRSASG